jgi:hypothetical protein
MDQWHRAVFTWRYKISATNAHGAEWADRWRIQWRAPSRRRRAFAALAAL